MRPLLLLVLLLCSTACAQQHDFQVATIKPSAPDAEKGTQIRGSVFATTGTTLADLLIYAYNVHPSQIVGAPEWLRTLKFDVLADPELAVRPTSIEMKAMVGRLLDDRFQLVIHREKRELPVYAIVQAGGEVKFKKTEGGPEGLPTGGFIPPNRLVVFNATLSNLADFLNRFSAGEIDRPVVDQTGIPGLFDFELRYTPANAQMNSQPADAPPGIFTAIKEQLGLKLQPTRAPVNVLSIAAVSKPTPN